MRKQLLCGVAAVAITATMSGGGLAADLPLKTRRPAPEIVQPITWTGLYIGGHLGGGWANWDGIYDSFGDLNPFESKPSGWVGGMQIGQNRQWDSFVLGWEADVSAAGLDRNFIVQSTSCCSVRAAFTTNVNLLATLRGRVGWTFDRALLYVTGGLAYAHAREEFISTSFRMHGGSNDHWGGVVGGGIEWKYNPNWSIRGEALYYIFDNSKSFTNHDNSQRASLNLNDVLVARFGVNYHFTPGTW